MHLELRISPRIFEIIWNGTNGILRDLGETDPWKNLKSKISWQYPFNWDKTSSESSFKMFVPLLFRIFFKQNRRTFQHIHKLYSFHKTISYIVAKPVEHCTNLVRNHVEKLYLTKPSKIERKTFWQVLFLLTVVKLIMLKNEPFSLTEHCAVPKLSFFVLFYLMYTTKKEDSLIKKNQRESFNVLF